VMVGRSTYFRSMARRWLSRRVRHGASGTDKHGSHDEDHGRQNSETAYKHTTPKHDGCTLLLACATSSIAGREPRSYQTPATPLLDRGTWREHKQAVVRDRLRLLISLQRDLPPPKS